MAAEVRGAFVAALIGLALLSRPAAAEPAANAPTKVDPIRAERAQALHDEAAALYESGEYRVAIGKLEDALKLDPTGKELVYNLALIHERLGEVDAAEADYRRYLDMETDPRVREKVFATLKRLEGAKKELSRRAPTATAAAPAALANDSGFATDPSLPARRFTPWAVALGSFAATGFVVGTVFGISAIARNPGGSGRTGNGVAIGDLQSDAITAHRDAVVADLSFLAGAIAGAAAVYVYVIGRPSHPGDPASARTAPPRAPPRWSRGAVVEF